MNASASPGIKVFAAADAVIIILLLGAAAACLPLLSSQAPATVAAYCDNRLIAEYPLAENREFTVTGAVGPMRIVIRDKRAFVASSTCRNGICTHTAPVCVAGSQIICVPNHMVVEIRAPHSRNGTDAATR
jgi:hypothetical protein